MADDGHVVSRGTSKGASVTDLLLEVGHDGTFGDGAHRKDVADSESGLLSGVDELASVHAFIGDEGLCVVLELVRVTEGNPREGCASAGIVDDFLHDTTNISVPLSIVECPELCWRLVETGVGRCRGGISLELSSHTKQQYEEIDCAVDSLKIDPRPFL